MYWFACQPKKGLQEMVRNLRKAEALGKRQIIGSHFDFNHEGEVTGYCNLGVLRCMKEPVTTINRSDILWGNIIIKLYNIPAEFVTDDYLPPFPLREYGKSVKGEGGSSTSLENYMWLLNDTAKLTFSETADWIEATFL